MIAKLVLVNWEYESVASPDYPTTWEREDIAFRYALYAVLLGVLVIVFLLELIFIAIGIMFYAFLRDHEHLVYPGELEPRTSYNHHTDHAILREEHDPKREVRVTATTIEPRPTYIRNSP